jgi:mycofactocin precursor
MNEKEKDTTETTNDDEEEAIYSVREIKIEEMAIDGICGVY